MIFWANSDWPAFLSLMIPGALVCDALVGDPRWSVHPVVLMGKLISFCEKRLLRSEHSAWTKRFAGALLVFVVLTVIYEFTWYLIQFMAWLPAAVNGLLQAFFLSFTISPRSLAEAGREIRVLLEQNDLVQARVKVGWIVGRDTERLSEAEVTRATVETIAENIVDGIIAPLFYAAIGGLPLAYLYRAVNTLDSMVGYKNEKYSDFGMVAARVDDILNWIPARVTGVLIVFAACLLRYQAKNALRMMHRDAAKHPSPNSGYPEAAVAGALGAQLGGLNYYSGMPSLRAHMGDSTQPLTAGHIRQVTRLMYVTTLLFVGAVSVLFQFLIHYGG